MIEEYQIIVKRSKRKTVSIYIERDGTVTVLAPESIEQALLDEIIKAQEYKIYKYQAKRKLLNENAVNREPVNGQSFLYLGRNYYLQYSNEVDKIEFKGRYFYVPRVQPEKLTTMFKEFYRSRGKKFLLPRINKYSELMGLSIDEFSVIDLKTRWASCSVKKPKLNFHWKIMMAPARIIDYLIVHELSHIKYPRHNAEFWNSVDKVMPDYPKHVAWLEKYGASLEL